MIPLDPARAEPLQEQIFARIREDIVGGKLLPGDRLPSTRVLAADLDVSRNTVMAAFEKLRLEGYVVGEVGGGIVNGARGGRFHVRAQEATASVARRAWPTFGADAATSATVSSKTRKGGRSAAVRVKSGIDTL